MSLPKHIQQHIEDVEQMEQQLQAPVDPQAENQGEAEDGQTEQATSSDTFETQSSQNDTPEHQSEEKWEHKYRRLQGKYDAEVPRLHQDLRELRDVVAALQRDQHNSQAEPAPPSKSKESLITPSDVDAFGDDLIDLQRRVARETLAEFSSEISAIRKENAHLKEQMTQVRGVSFEAKLNQAIPDFSQINRDPAWVAWLNEVDPLLRAPRRTVAQAAYEAGDVEAVKGYVELYRKTLPAIPGNKSGRQAELQRQVQPSKSVARGNSAQQAHVYSASESKRTYEKIQRLISQGRYDDADALEQEISAAYVEGRVSA